MRGKTIFGALLVSVALCSQGFGFELLDRMLGLNGGGCGECNACAKVAGCGNACEKACPAPAACEQACGEKACGKCRKCYRTPVRDLFAGLKDICESKGTYCETGACATAKGCCPEPAVCEKACPKACDEVACEKPCRVKKCRKPCREKANCAPAACEQACAAPCAPACEKACEPKCHKLYRRPIVELLENLCGSRKCRKAGCEVGNCEVSCGPAGCDGAAPSKAAPAPVKAAPEAAPLPAAPKADPSASIESRGIFQASRTLARN